MSLYAENVSKALNVFTYFPAGEDVTVTVSNLPSPLHIKVPFNYKFRVYTRVLLLRCPPGQPKFLRISAITCYICARWKCFPGNVSKSLLTRSGRDEAFNECVLAGVIVCNWMDVLCSLYERKQFYCLFQKTIHNYII